jgi:hypothetical protein
MSKYELKTSNFLTQIEKLRDVESEREGRGAPIT